MLAKERKEKPNTYRGHWGEGKELQCIVSVYHIFLNVSQHNVEQKHHSAGAGAAAALHCSTQQQHSQSQSQRSAGLLSSSSVVIPPWRADFMSSLSIKMSTRIGWHFFFPPQNRTYMIHPFYRGQYLWPFPSLIVSKEVEQHQKRMRYSGLLVCVFSFRKKQA